MRDRWYEYVNPKYLAYLSSAHWRKMRERVIKRCNNVCERCGKYYVSEVHHLTYERLGKEEMEDLQGVCALCHDFLHGRRSEDGAAVYERVVREREERLKPVRAEIERYEARPDLYRHFPRGSFASHHELIALLRENPRVFGITTEVTIVNPHFTKRKYDSAVIFRLHWRQEEGEAMMNVRDAEEWLSKEGMVLDTERHLWVEIGSLRERIKRLSIRRCPAEDNFSAFSY